MDNTHFRPAMMPEWPIIWEILQQGIQKRKEEGSNQWQDGYPNPDAVKSDIETGAGHVLLIADEIVGYCAILINDEPAYDTIEGAWLTKGDFVVYHRVAIAQNHTGKGLSYKLMEEIEAFAKQRSIRSLRSDTNHDNHAMLRAFEKCGYTYCGEVYFRGSPRKAYEKILD